MKKPVKKSLTPEELMKKFEESGLQPPTKEDFDRLVRRAAQPKDPKDKRK